MPGETVHRALAVVELTSLLGLIQGKGLKSSLDLGYPLYRSILHMLPISKISIAHLGHGLANENGLALVDDLWSLLLPHPFPRHWCA